MYQVCSDIRFFILPVVLVLFQTLCASSKDHFSPSGVGKDRELRSDTVVVTNIYRYRSIAVRYDSVTAACMFGEMFIIGNGSDSLQINWPETFTIPGLDTSATFINSLRSKSFAFNTTDMLSYFRMIYMTFLDTTSNYTLPDTTAWIVELRDTQNGNLISVLDSIGICRAINYDRSTFPPTYGFTGEKGYELIEIPLETISSQTDSVYIVIRIKNMNTSNDPYCGISDDRTVNTKFTEDFHLLAKKSDRSTDRLPEKIDVQTFPNPVRSTAFIKIGLSERMNLTVTLFNNEGKEVKRLFRGFRDEGNFYLSLPINSLPSGQYWVNVTSDGGVSFNSKKLSIMK